jgi:hypothetical protein
MADKTGEETAEAPATEAPPSESTETVVDQQPEPKTESPESETGTNEVGEAPKENAAWAAMRTENKRLKEAVGVDPEYLKSLHGAVSSQELPNQQIPQVTGDADYTQVTQGVNWANSQAAQARRETAQLRNQLELQQDREAERAYPELKTDKGFQQVVAEKKLAARVLGHDRTTLEIADEVAKLLGRREEQVKVQAAQDTKEQILQRQVISSEPKGQTSSGKSATTNEDLRKRVRKGDTEAETEMAKGLIADLEF